MFENLKRFFRRRTTAQREGDVGEAAAAKFLRRKGMKILERNWRHRHSEIDIIARDGDAIVFVEVKTRRPNALVRGYYAADSSAKRRKVREGMKAYLSGMSPRPSIWRYDIIEVEISPLFEILEIRHFINV